MPSGPGARRSPAPSARAAPPRYGDSPSCLDHRAALLPQELRDVVGTAPALPRRPRALPPRERLRSGPGAGGGAGALVDVAHAGLDLVEEPLDFFGPLREDPSREAVLYLVGFRDRLVQPRDLGHGQERYEQLLEEQGG